MFLLPICTIFLRKEKFQQYGLPFLKFLNISHVFLPAVVLGLFTKRRLIFNIRKSWYIIIMHIKKIQG